MLFEFSLFISFSPDTHFIVHENLFLLSLSSLDVHLFLNCMTSSEWAHPHIHTCNIKCIFNKQNNLKKVFNSIFDANFCVYLLCLPEKRFNGVSRKMWFKILIICIAKFFHFASLAVINQNRREKEKKYTMHTHTRLFISRTKFNRK